MSEQMGMVLSIDRCSLHDGPGIRTTVFLKGCPLHCLWCHNPESIARQPELLYMRDRCTACGACARVCPHGCHTVENGTHTLDRASCVTCGKCADACPAGALEIKGHPMDASEVLAEVLKDRAYYEESGGGMTISGGEPMAQFAFTHELLSMARREGIHTCIETSGMAPLERYLDIAPLVSLFLIDWKETDPQLHVQWTGSDNAHIRTVITTLDTAGARILLRCPLVPSCNDRQDHLDGIAALANSLSHVEGIEVMPYHPMGASKSARLGKAYPLANRGFTDESVAEGWRAAIRRNARVSVC